MKTIAISIDETTLQMLEDLVAASPQSGSRSALVRAAVREFAERHKLREIEAREDKIVRQHKKQLACQARALIADQARS